MAPFFCAVDRSAMIRGDVAAPGGASALPNGSWVHGDILLTQRAELARDVGAGPGASDAELVLFAVARRGAGAMALLRGEYAFAAWDGPRRQLLVARDGIGLRVLHLAVTPATIAISDDPRRLLAVPGVDGTLDDGALLAFLASGYDEDSTRTVYRGVRAAPAGHLLTWRADAARFESARHWEFPSPSIVGPREARALPERFATAIADAVGDRLRAPQASILLSGGLDSAMLAAVARRARPEVTLRAFTASYAPLMPEDEVPWARRVAEHLEIPLEVVPCAARAPLSDVARTPTPLDEPTWSEWRRLLAAAGQWSATVLYGEDGDSILLPATLREMLRAEPWPRVAIALIAYVARHRRVPFLGTGLRVLLGATDENAPTPRPEWLRAPLEPAEPFVCVVPPTPAPLRDRPRRRLTTPFLQSLVRACASTWTGVPTRLTLPLLDDRVLTVAMSAPSHPWLQGKALLRAAATHVGALPAEVVARPKTPAHGLHEALVAQWRAQWDGRVELAAPLRSWIDREHLARALRDGTAVEVAAAWRALQLSSWLDARDASGAPQ